MSGGRPRTEPVGAALVRLADLAGRGVKPTRMEREVEAIVANWIGGPGLADLDEVAERLAALHEQLAAGMTDAAEQLADVDRSDGAAARHAGLVHTALVAAVAAVERYQEPQPSRTDAEPLAAAPAAAAPVGEQAESVVARRAPSTTGHAVTIDPLAARNPQGVDHLHPAEVRAAGPSLAPPAPARKKRTKKKPSLEETDSHSLLG